MVPKGNGGVMRRYVTLDSSGAQIGSLKTFSPTSNETDFKWTRKWEKQYLQDLVWVREERKKVKAQWEEQQARLESPETKAPASHVAGPALDRPQHLDSGMGMGGCTVEWM